MTKPPTMQDVADKTGLSLSTVSLALRDSPKIPESTRQLIREAAKALGYRANPLLAALSAHRWRPRPHSSGTTLALLADGELEGAKGMADRAASFGYRTEVFQIRDYPNPRRLSNLLYSRGIPGLVVGQIFTPGFCAAFDWSRFVAVACCEGCERPPVNLVMPNHFLSIQEGWDHARELGYRRIGMVMFEEPGALDCHERLAAFLERQREMPAKDRIPVLAVASAPRKTSNVAVAQTQRQETVAIVKEWLTRQKPDVVLGFNGAFLWIMKEAGCRIPEDVAFISLWGPVEDTLTTGLVLTTDEVGIRAIDWLDSLLRSGECGIPRHPATMQIDMVWQAGKTAPKVPVRK